MKEEDVTREEVTKVIHEYIRYYLPSNTSDNKIEGSQKITNQAFQNGYDVSEMLKLTEKYFNINIPSKAYSKIDTVDDLINLVIKYHKTNHAK